MKKQQKKRYSDSFKIVKIILIIYLVFPVFTLAGQDTWEASSRKAFIKSVLEGSVFNTDSPPTGLAEGKIATYDPMLVTITASVKSRLPGRDDSQWTEVELPPSLTDPDSSLICPNPFKALIRHTTTSNPYTFVILPGAYSWGISFNNQTIAALDKKFDNPTIIIFTGYLSPVFLEGTCKEIPWNGAAIAKDFYLRLRVYLSEIKAQPEYTGVIGFSGGGGLAIGILGTDAQSSKINNGENCFGLGGAVFSPTLHGRTIFENLDTSIKGIAHSRVLTTVGPEWAEASHVWFLAKAMIANDWGLDWRDVINLYESGVQNFWERSLNEFTYVDLKDTLTAVGFDIDQIKGEFGYYNTYINTGLRNTLKGIPSRMMTKAFLDKSYDTLQDANSFLDSVDRPLLIYFSQDDPILSSYDASGQPQAITEILEQAEKNPNITVFNPRYGAHIGAFLDPVFDDLIHSVFIKGENSPSYLH
ncbi:MAG: hypothetical protein OXH36_01615 [Bdellovibrionales bacterium]|nr:hypothetical protein [Bdellovibrionales bacterium]